jgi:ABC-type lipoprotein release transport system permease subunit
MTTLFGISLDIIARDLLILAAILIGLMFLWGVRHPLLVWMGLRNVPRRRARMVLIIFGLMLATMFIAGAFAIGDTIITAVRSVAVYNLGRVDEQVLGGYGPLGLFAERHGWDIARDLKTDPQVSGVAPALVEPYTILVADITSRQVRSRVTALALPPGVTRGFGGMHLLSGQPVSIARLGPHDVYLNRMLGQLLNAQAGDRLYLFSQRWPGRRYEFRVRGIIASTGLVGDLSTLVMPLRTLQDIEHAQGLINRVFIANTGDGLSGVVYSDSIDSRMRPLLGWNGLHVEDVKEEGLAIAEKAEAIFGSIFSLFCLFSLAIGLLLIFLIFVLLAAERRAEMGMARAVGMKRHQLVQVFLYEGAAYDLIAALIGVALGVSLGIIMVHLLGPVLQSIGFPLQVTLSPRSMIISFCLGVIFTFITIVAAAWSVSRMTVAAALRDLPEPPRPRPSLLPLATAPFALLRESAQLALVHRWRRSSRMLVDALVGAPLRFFWGLCTRGVVPLVAGILLVRSAIGSSQITFSGGLSPSMVTLAYLPRPEDAIAFFSGGLSLAIIGVALALRALIITVSAWRARWLAGRMGRMAVVAVPPAVWTMNGQDTRRSGRRLPTGKRLNANDPPISTTSHPVASESDGQYRGQESTSREEFARVIAGRGGADTDAPADGRHRACIPPATVYSQWHRVADRLAAACAGLGLLLYWALPFDALSRLGFPRFASGIEVFFVAGIMMVIGAVWVIAYNGDLLLWPVMRLLALSRRMGIMVRLALVYPLHHRFRSGVGLMMFALVVFTMTVMAVIASSMARSYGSVKAQTGGYDIQAQAWFQPIPNIQRAIARQPSLNPNDIAAVGTLTPLGVAIIQPDAPQPGWRFYLANSVTGSFLDGLGLKLVARARGFTNDAQVWQTLRDHPGYAVIDSQALPGSDQSSLVSSLIGALPSSYAQSAGDLGELLNQANGDYSSYIFQLAGIYAGERTIPPTPVWVTDLRGGRAERLIIIGIVDNSDGQHPGLWASQQTFVPTEAGLPPADNTQYFFKLRPGVDAHKEALALGSVFLDNGLETTVIADLVLDINGPRIFLSNVMLGVVALTLLLGLAALAISGTRAVVERRQQIGMLRALGMKRRSIQLSFLLESFLIGVAGTLVGVILGLVLCRNVYAVDFFARYQTGLEFAIPWGKLAFIITSAFTAALLAAFVPAWQAGHVMPADALRYE